MDWKQEVFKRIDAIAEKLGVTAQYLWGVLVKQAQVEAITYIPWMVLWSLMLITGLTLIVVFARKLRKDEAPDNDVYGTVFLSSGIGSLVGLISLIFCVTEALPLWLNPEYFAFKKVMELIGK